MDRLGLDEFPSPPAESADDRGLLALLHRRRDILAAAAER
eukprot:CAMPEP_0118883922 /NCGR_PEP_ID=MMETSP1163-20130328/22895_1 /TAXON_ID=124430 /ORGANISM="Phaeomonas parva, Strain CCMP2877" /LENGTH=39 /DNA_ID= /DNA_START= /DNA_END= /DNA_ORIENTATION=